MNNERQIAAVTLETAQQNLATAKLTHRKIVEQLSMRTATVAQIAGTLVALGKLPPDWGAKGAVSLAEEIMAEAELSAAKLRALEESLKNDPGL
jgi:hypothetical protein